MCYYKQLRSKLTLEVIKAVDMQNQADKIEKYFKSIINNTYFGKVVKEALTSQHGTLSGYTIAEKLRKQLMDDEVVTLISRVISLHHIADNVSLKDDPFLFLLILCDSLQEWGREEEIGEKYREYLTNPSRPLITYIDPDEIEELKDTDTIRIKFGVRVANSDARISHQKELMGAKWDEIQELINKKLNFEDINLKITIDFPQFKNGNELAKIPKTVGI